ncbi:MAG: redoxin domain-containing protein [Chitinophagaceae bacterium]
MKQFLSVLSFCCLLSVSFSQTKKNPVKPVITKSTNNGYHLKVKITPLANRKVYLGTYYGKGKILVDSTILDATNSGAFKANKKLVEGIYFVVSPNYSILFEILVGKKQDFSVVADTAKKEDVLITGSPDNDLFKQYSIGSFERGQAIYALEEKYKNATSTQDSNSLRKQIIAKREELEVYRNNIINKNPGSLLGALLSAMKRPEAPAIPIVNGKADSTYPYRFVKDHFWDDVLFADERLLRTPFFEQKIDEFYKYYIAPDADSIIPEVKTMLIGARSSKEMFAYLLTKFTNKYLNPEFMGQDKVFLYLFTEFYAKGDTTILDAKSRKMIFERGYYMMANQLNNPAPELNLVDIEGNSKPLYSFKNKFTFIAFYDPTCGHCKEELPRIDSIYNAKWKDLGVGVYAINIKENLLKEWKEFIAEKKLSSNWWHVYKTKESKDEDARNNIPTMGQLYDVTVTPTFYLLDENKQIIAKRLSLSQFDDVIRVKLQKK